MEGLTLTNPFYVDPTGGVDMGQRYAQAGSALMGYSQMKDQREAQQAERDRVAAAEQRMKSGIEAIQGAINDPAKMANVMLEYPELAKQAEAVFGFSNDQTRPIVEQTYAMVLTDPQNATQHLQRGIDAVTAAGGTPNMMNRDLQMFTENPEQALKAVEIGVAATAPNIYKAFEAKQAQRSAERAAAMKGQQGQELPAAVQEAQWFLNLPDEQKTEVLTYKGRGGPGYVEKKEIDRAAKILESPANYSDEEVAQAQSLIGGQIPVGQQLYGGLSSDKANALYTSATEAEQSWNQLSRSINLLEDMKDANQSLTGANAQNFMQTMFGEVLGMDNTEAARQAAAVESGNFDIARQLAQALRPVSEKQLEITLKSLQGGNIDAAIQALRGTAKQAQGTYERNVRQLRANKAGIVDDFPLTLEYERSPNVIQREDVEFSQQPQSEFPNAPQVGTIDSGYRFLGGDPANPNNWEAQ